VPFCGGLKIPPTAFLKPAAQPMMRKQNDVEKPFPYAMAENSSHSHRRTQEAALLNP
jgi:hypothetical protein